MLFHARSVGAVVVLTLLASCTPGAQVTPGQAIIGPSGGTLVSADSKASIEIPANALSAPTTITLKAVSAANLPASPSGAQSLVAAYELSASGGATLTQPATLTINYGAGAMSVASQAVLPKAVWPNYSLFLLVNNSWQAVFSNALGVTTAQCQLTETKAVCKVTSFGTYGLFNVPFQLGITVSAVVNSATGATYTIPPAGSALTNAVVVKRGAPAVVTTTLTAGASPITKVEVVAVLGTAPEQQLVLASQTLTDPVPANSRLTVQLPVVIPAETPASTYPLVVRVTTQSSATAQTGIIYTTVQE